MTKEEIPLVCPACAASIGMAGNLPGACRDCGFAIRTIHDIPVLRENPDGSEIDQTFTHDVKELEVRDSSEEPIPFIHEALDSGKLVLEVGAGIERCANPNLITTDGFIYDMSLDFVVDAHKLPFAANTFDYAFSLSVFEHLHSPWLAADELFRVLKPGGKVFTLVAFQQHLHGFPHHYFNVAIPGARKLFEKFADVSVAPSQCASFDQIAYILMDFSKMLDNLEERARADRPEGADTREAARRLARLKKGLTSVVDGISFFGEALKVMPENREAWELVAPALDIVATKPPTA